MYLYYVSANVHINNLLSGMTTHGRYDYLQIILTKNCDRTIGQEYLMVTRNAFGVVKLLAVEYLKDNIRMDFQCTSTGTIKSTFVDVEDHTWLSPLLIGQFTFRLQ